MTPEALSALVGAALGFLLFWGWIPIGRHLRGKGLPPEEEVRAIGQANTLHFILAGVMIWLLKSIVATPTGAPFFVLGSVVGLALLANQRT